MQCLFEVNPCVCSSEPDLIVEVLLTWPNTLEDVAKPVCFCSSQGFNGICTCKIPSILNTCFVQIADLLPNINLLLHKLNFHSILYRCIECISPGGNIVAMLVSAFLSRPESGAFCMILCLTVLSRPESGKLCMILCLTYWSPYWSLYWRCVMSRVGQNRIYTPYMNVYLAISLPKIPYMHRI